MSEIFFELQEQLRPLLRTGDVVQCQQHLKEKLAALPSSPFHIALNLAIANEPREVASYFDEFFSQQPLHLVAAAYTEMNGFDINPDRWFCSAFAYQRYGGHEDYDWLSNWQSGEYPTMVIRGFEELQQVYSSAASRDREFEDARSVTNLIVVTAFQDLIRRSASHMVNLRFPLLVTAHDYDFIYEVRPSSGRGEN